MRLTTVAIIFMTLFVVSNAYAEARREGGGDVQNKMKLQMRQLMQDRDAERAKSKKLESDIVKLREKLEAKEKKVKKLKPKLDKTAERGHELAERLQDSFDKLRDSYEKSHELQSNLNITTVERDEARGELQHCMVMNVKLYEAGIEVVKLYEKEATLKVEPVFQLKAVEIENLVQDYRFKMEDFTLKNKPKKTQEAAVGSTATP